MSDDKKNDQMSLVPSTPQGLTTRSTNLVRRGLDSIKRKDGRIVHFPSDYSLGTYYLRREGECLYPGKAACGDIFVPSGMTLKLQIDSGTPLIALSTLKPDDLLALTCWDFTDSELAHLGGLSSLKELSLMHCNISDNGLAHLKELVSLERLALGNHGIGNKGLVKLSGMTSLTELGLWENNISDEGLAHLQKLTCLKELDLSLNKISDEGLAYLRGMTSLKLIDLSMNKISDGGLALLQKWLPECQIYF